MGRQVNFYMLAEDLLEFEERVRSKEKVLFVKDRLSASEIQTLDTLAIPEMGTTSLLLYLVREKMLKKCLSSLLQGSIGWLIYCTPRQWS